MAVPNFLNSPEFNAGIYQNILAKSSTLSSKLFRVEIVDGAAKFISNISGRQFSNMSDAYSYVVGNRFSDYVELAETSLRGATHPFMTPLGDPNVRTSSILRGINEQIKGMSRQERDVIQQRLNAAGANIDLSNRFSINMITMTASKGEAGAMAEQVTQGLSSGRLKGIPLFDDEGGRIMQFVSGKTGTSAGTVLTEAQSNILLASLDRTFLRQGYFENLAEGIPLTGDGPDELVGKYFSDMSKLMKRIKGDVSPRDLEITEDILSKALGGRPGSRTLAGRTLITDPQYEMLYGYAQGSFGDIKDAGLRAYYGSDDALSVSRNLVEELLRQTKGSADDIANFRNVLIRSTNEIGGPIRVGDVSSFLSDNLKESFSNNLSMISDEASRERVANIFSHVFDGLEKADDGSIIMNTHILRNIKGQLQQEIGSLQNAISSGDGLADLSLARQELQQKETLLRNISGEFDQITVRGTVLGTNIKAAASVRELIDGLSGNYDFIMSKSAFKKAYGFSNEEGVVLSGFGKGRGIVYTDPVGIAFNQELYTSEAAMQGMRQNFDQILGDFRTSVTEGTIPERLRRAIDNAAEASTDFLPTERSPSAIANRAYAMELQEMLRSGISPQHSPKMMNMLYHFMKSQAYSTKDGSYRIAMQDAFRFAIDTEEKHVLGTNVRSVLGTGYEEMRIGGQDVRLPKFRLRGKQMLISGASVSDMFDALGGFDLDDKGIPRMAMLDTDSGRRLAFFTLRQPQGAQEYALQVMSNDIESIQSLFGIKSESAFASRFRGTLSTMIGEMEEGVRAGRTSSIDLLQARSLQNIVSTELPIGSGNIVPEDIFMNVIQRMQADQTISLVNIAGEGQTARLFNEIIRSGGGPLTLQGSAGSPVQGDLMKRFSRLGISRLDEDTGRILYDQSSKKFIQTLKELVNAPEYANLDPSLRSLINSTNLQDLSATQGAIHDRFSEILRLMHSDTLADPVLGRSLASNAYTRMALSKLTDTENILGTYVNNSMLVGSTRSQMEALADALPSNLRGLMARNIIPLPGQETVIDLATTLNFEGVGIRQSQLIQSLQMELSSLNLEIGDISESAQRQILRNMGFEGLSQDATKFFNLKELSEIQSRVVLGQQMGTATTAFYRAGISDVDLLPGIDIDFARKAFGNDYQSARMFLENYIQGMQTAREGFENVQLEERIARAQGVLAQSRSQEFMDDFYNLISLSNENSKYRSFSVVQDLAREMEILANNIYKGLMSSAEDLPLMNLKVDDESRFLARSIVSRNRESLDSLYGMLPDSYNQLSELEQLGLAERRLRFSYEFLNEINEAAIAKNVSFDNLVNALDKEMIDARYRLENLANFIGDTPEMAHTQAIRERVRDIQGARSRSYYRAMGSELSEQLANRLRAIDPTDIRAAASSLLASGADDVGEVAADVLRKIIDTNLEFSTSGDAAQSVNRMLSAQAQATQAFFHEPTGGSFGAVTAPDDARPMAGVFRDMYEGMDLTEDMPKGSRPKYTRISEKIRDGSLTNLFQDKLIKRSLLGAAALIAGSFVYGASKDRTVDNMQGPPLLPGGSAYEDRIPQRPFDIPEYLASGSSSVSYQISLNGNRQDVNRFMEQAGNMGVGNFNATIYNALPAMNRDLYSSFGSSF